MMFLLLPLAISAAFPCEWTSPDGHKFDFSALSIAEGHEEYRTQDLTSIFTANVCEPSHSDPKCTGDNGLVCQYDLRTGDYVSTLAKAENPTWSYIEPNEPGIGVKMTLQNGDLCQRNRPAEHTTFIAPRDTIFLFRCAATKNDGLLFSIFNELPQCLTVITFHTPLACSAETKPGQEIPPNEAQPPPAPPPQPLEGGPVGGEGQEGPPAPDVPGEPEAQRQEEEAIVTHGRHRAAVILLPAIAVCYVVLGCVYKRQKFGASGMEACPNHDFWKRFPVHMLDCANCIVSKLCCKSGNGEYEPLPTTSSLA